jgi:hypothetical protein
MKMIRMNKEYYYNLFIIHPISSSLIKINVVEMTAEQSSTQNPTNSDIPAVIAHKSE